MKSNILVWPGGMREAIEYPPAHLWWCYGRVGCAITEILLPSFSEGETTGPRIPPGRAPLGKKTERVRVLRVKFRTLWRGRDSRA